MRIVLLGQETGGARGGDASAVALQALAGALRRQGVETGVVTPAATPTHAAAASGAAPSFAGPRDRRRQEPGGWDVEPGWRSLTSQWRALRRPARAAWAEGADLVHAHSWFPAAMAAPGDAPLVLSVYAPDVRLLRASRLARRLARPVFARAAVVTAASRTIADMVQQLAGRYVSRTHVQAMPIDTASWPWSSGGGGAVAVAPLVASQRLELTIHTIAVLASCGHGLPLTIIGRGPRQAELARFADRNGVGGLVDFVDPVSPDEILRYLGTADLLLHTAKADPAAPWVLAAVLLGVPVVGCWDGGGIVDLVHEKGAGRLVLPSTEALSDAAIGVLLDPIRFDLARVVGEAWRARVAPDQVADVALGWYREALGG